MSWAPKRAALLAGLTLALSASAARAETAREILDRQHTLDAGPRRWADRYQRMQLTVIERGGSGRHLEIEIYDRKEPDQRCSRSRAPSETAKYASFHNVAAVFTPLRLPATCAMRLAGG